MTRRDIRPRKTGTLDIEHDGYLPSGQYVYLIRVKYEVVLPWRDKHGEVQDGDVFLWYWLAYAEHPDEAEAMKIPLHGLDWRYIDELVETRLEQMLDDAEPVLWGAMVDGERNDT